MELAPLGASLNLLRSLARWSHAARAAEATALDSFSKSLADPPSRNAVDGDGEVIERRGNPDRLGELVDHGKVGPGPNDCNVIKHKGSPGDDHGYVVIGGKTHPTDMLTVALDKDISGIEAPELVEAGAENYFADAWKAGREQAARAHGLRVDEIPRDFIALAVNSQNERSQDRLHIHADRLDPELGKQLKQRLGRGDFARGTWAPVEAVQGHQYRALWVEGEDLQVNPFKIVYDQLVAEHGEQYARTHMGQHSIAVVAQTDPNGRPGFLIIDGRHGSDPAQAGGPHDSGSAEEWLMSHANTPR